MNNKYSVEYYLMIPSFRKWIKNPDRELNAYWLNYLENNKDCIEYIEEAKEILSSIKFSEHELEEGKSNELWFNIHNKINQEKKSDKPIIIKNLNYYTKVAATFLIIVSTFFIIYRFISYEEPEPVSKINYIKKSTQYGEKMTIKLKDGSTVKLNSGSSVIYPEHFGTHSRQINLTGEAYFEVKKNALPFIVETENLEVKALGTSFFIQSYPKTDSTTVSLTSGKVMVSEIKKKVSVNQLFLDAGQSASYNLYQNQLIKYNFLDQQLTSWINNIIIFKNANWQEMEQKLEKWFGVEIDY